MSLSKKRFWIIGVLIFSVFVVVLLYHSIHPQRALTRQIVEMEGIFVNLDFNKAEVFLDGIDSVYRREDVTKLVIFVDSLSCSSCFLSHMMQYYDINDSLDVHDGHLLVILHPQQSRVDEVRKKLKAEKYPFWCVIDKDNEFLSNNPTLPDNKLLHTFLLNNDNRIILIGDPANNPRIRELFLKQLHQNMKN